MRYIQIPQPVVINEKFTADFVITMVMNSWTVDTRWGHTVKKLMQAADIRRAFEAKKAGDWVSLQDELWQALCEVVETPTAPYIPEIVLKCMHFFSAILKASDQKPLALAEPADEPS